MNFENGESCKRNKNYSNNKFSIETVSKKDVLNLIKEPSGNKSTVSNDIPVSVLKESVAVFYDIF